MSVVISGAKSADLIVFFSFQCAQIKWQNGEWTKGILSSRNCDFGAQFFKTMQSWVLALVEHCLSFECENTYQSFLTKYTLLICDLSLKRFTSIFFGIFIEKRFAIETSGMFTNLHESHFVHRVIVSISTNAPSAKNIMVSIFCCV